MDQNHRNKAKKLASRPCFVEVTLDETTDGEPVYVAKTPELDGCFGQGETIDDAVQNLSEARVDFIQNLLEDNFPIPEPFSTTTTTSLSFTLTLRYRQSDTVNLSETEPTSDSIKPMLLFEGAKRT